MEATIRLHTARLGYADCRTKDSSKARDMARGAFEGDWPIPSKIKVMIDWIEEYNKLYEVNRSNMPNREKKMRGNENNRSYQCNKM